MNIVFILLIYFDRIEYAEEVLLLFSLFLLLLLILLLLSSSEFKLLSEMLERQYKENSLSLLFNGTIVYKVEL